MVRDLARLVRVAFQSLPESIQLQTVLAVPQDLFDDLERLIVAMLIVTIVRCAPGADRVAVHCLFPELKAGRPVNLAFCMLLAFATLNL